MSVFATGGNPGAMTPAQIVGATGGIFQAAAGGQFNLEIPGSGRFEGVPFEVQCSGWVKFMAGTYTATLVAALYAVAGSAAWTAAAGNKIAASTSISFTIASATAVTVPVYLEVDVEGDSISGLLQGIMWDVINNIKDATNNLAILTNAPTGVNFQTGGAGNPAASGQTAVEPILQFAAGITLTNAGASTVCNLSRLVGASG